MTKVETLLKEIDAKSLELHTVFEEAGNELNMDLVKSVPGDSAAKVAFVRERSEELADLRVLLQDAIAVEKAKDDLGETKFISEMVEAALKGKPLNSLTHVGGEETAKPKSFGDSFYKGFDPAQKGKEFTLDDFEVKTLFETAAGWLPETTRSGRLLDYPTPAVSVLDFIPTTTTTQAAIVFMEEGTWTNNAAETSEGAQYPESAFALTPVTSTVRKIAHFIPVTDEQLEDVPQASAYLDRNMRKGLRERMALQVLVGDGTAPNLSGILDRAIQTQALGTDPVPDAVYKALVKVRVPGYGVPNLVVMNPNDWQGVRLLRTADGIYIWGSPSEAGPATIWGLPVAQESRLTENTGLVGDFDYCDLAYKRGVEVKISDSHSDYFIKGKQAIRADVRVGFQVYRPYAFCSITGI